MMQEHKYVGGFIAAWYAGDVSQQLPAIYNPFLVTMIALCIMTLCTACNAVKLKVVSWAVLSSRI